MTVTYTCQQCDKTGIDRDDFKRVDYRGIIQFSFVLCNKCAEEYKREESND